MIFSGCGDWGLFFVAMCWLLIEVAFLIVEHGLCSCGLRAQLLHSMWDLPGPGVEPMSPALAGRFFTTQPPGKPRSGVFKQGCCAVIHGVAKSQTPLTELTVPQRHLGRFLKRALASTLDQNQNLEEVRHGNLCFLMALKTCQVVLTWPWLWKA